MIMDCYNCGGTYRETTDFLKIDDDYVGPIRIEGVPYFICDNCGKILYTKEMSQAIEKHRDNRIEELLKSLPLGNFISATETASLLRISRQALNKNRRISRGFIYHTKIGNFTVFLRRSVLQFIETGDGRFPLHCRQVAPLIKYAESLQESFFTRQYSNNMRISQSKQNFLEDYGILKENSYAKR